MTPDEQRKVDRELAEARRQDDLSAIVRIRRRVLGSLDSIETCLAEEEGKRIAAEAEAEAVQRTRPSLLRALKAADDLVARMHEARKLQPSKPSQKVIELDGEIEHQESRFRNAWVGPLEREIGNLESSLRASADAGIASTRARLQRELRRVQHARSIRRIDGGRLVSGEAAADVVLGEIDAALKMLAGLELSADEDVETALARAWEAISWDRVGELAPCR